MSPVRYTPAVEKPIDNEEQVHHDLIDTMRSITEKTSVDYKHAVRSVHAKSHGIIEAELTIAPDLPPELAQGLFANPGTYQTILRISTNPGDILDDSVSAPRGMAIKVLGVEGERLPDSADDTTQNFVLISAPAFAAPNAAKFLGSLKQLAATTDKGEGAKKVLSAALRGVESVIEAVGGKSAMIATMGGAPITHPLGDPYYSATAFRYGEYIAKIGLFPVSPNLTDLHGNKVNTSNRPDALREVVSETMIEQGGTWELRVQLNTDLEKMPIEDATQVWDEDVSPYRTVARIVAEPQASWTMEKVTGIDEGLFFSPWHGLAAHQPLGSVNRARRQAYEMSAEFRGKFNGCPVHDSVPTAAVGG